ncbi:MAG: NEW3 domain-containing protein [Acidimicrobiia bacterium]
MQSIILSRRVQGLLGALLVVSATPLPAAAQQPGPVQITTPYPAVAVEAGGSATFDLEVSAAPGEPVDLEVTEAPEGWATTIRGGGFVVDAVTPDAEEPPALTLEVEVPAEAAEGDYQVVINAAGAAGSDVLALRLRVAEAAAGSVTLETEFPSLRGASDRTFPFDLDLTNDTPGEIAFSLQGQGPEGWLIDVHPSAETQAATASVAAGETAGIRADVDPPDDAPAGTYQVMVRAVGGGKTVEATLEVEITGNFALTLTTPDQRLNAQVRSGGSTEVPLLIFNDGTAPLVGLQLSSTPPAGWEVTFQPEVVEQIPPGSEPAQVTATIQPSGEAVAGDYSVVIEAGVAEADDRIELRTTVETSPFFGLIGLALIAAVLVGLGWVFRRYGRR